MLQTLGKYQLVRKLATGGMAELFLARVDGARGFQKHVAVKVILPHLGEDPQFTAMFLDEAKLAAQLNHPNIVHIFDFGEVDQSLFIAMEYIDGADLRALMREAARLGTALPLPFIAKVIALACEGLDYAHKYVDPGTQAPLALVHRDMSPDNVLVSRTGAVKIVDFGVAKISSPNPDRDGTQTGVLKGKFSYMSPEQFRGLPLDGRSDIFSLGMVLYELIAGTKPFDSTNAAQVMQSVVNDTFPPLAQFRADVPEELQCIVDRALAKSRDFRYQSCLELADDLGAFVTRTGAPMGSYQIAHVLSDVMGLSSGSRALPGSGNTPPTREGSPGSMTSHEVELTPAPASALETTAGRGGTPAAPRDSRLLAAAFPRWRWRPGAIAFLAGSLLASLAYLGWLELRPLADPIRPGVAPVPHPPVLAAPGQSPPPAIVDREPAAEVVENPALRRRPIAAPRRHAHDVPHEVAVDAPAEPPAAAAPGTANGQLEFRVRPYASVYLDGKALGETPLSSLEVAGGVHQIRLVNAELKKDESFEVSIKAGQSTIVKRDLSE